MSDYSRLRSGNEEVAEPLFRDSNDDGEKSAQDQAHADAERRALQTSISRLKRWLVAVSVLLGFLCLYTLFSFRGVVMQDRKTLKQLSFAPEMPRHIVTFEEYPDFASGSTPTADEAWGQLNPPGDGFVLIPNPRSYDLPPGKSTEQGEVYDISVFHQLHCLNHVRTFLFTLKAGMENNNTREVYDTMLAAQEPHVYHCFDYIRQALMCHADLTVEWPRLEADGSRFAVDGWGIQHECVNWDHVLKFMEQYTVTNVFR